MKTLGERTPLVLPPALLAEVQAVANEEDRPALGVLRDAVHRYKAEGHARHMPAYVQERSRALDLVTGGEPRGL
jgi:hypothetical protein